MIRINLPEDNELKFVIRDLERGQEQVALSRLRSLRKAAQSRYAYAEKKLESASGMDYQVINAQVKEAKIQYEQMKDAVRTITDYVNNPEKYQFKEDRKNYFKVQRAFSRINVIQQKKAAEKEIVREQQREAGTVEGITLTTIKKSDKVKALLQNVVYKNKNFNVNEEELLRINEEIKQITGYDFINEDIIKSFDTAQHYESGDGGKGNIPIYDVFQNITKKLGQKMKSFKATELDILEKDLIRLAQMFKTNI